MKTALQAATTSVIGFAVFLLLVFWAAPPWLVVIFGAVAATVVSGIPMLNG